MSEAELSKRYRIFPEYIRTAAIYTAAPYAMLVYVPPPIAPKIVMQPGENSARARIIKPELRLIRRQR